jgi:hypothetical protein
MGRYANTGAGRSLLSTYHTSAAPANQKTDEQPLTWSYNLSIAHSLPFNSTLEIGCVGNRSSKLWETAYHNINAVPYGTLLTVPNANALTSDSFWLPASRIPPLFGGKSRSAAANGYFLNIAASIQSGLGCGGDQFAGTLPTLTGAPPRSK